LRVAGYFGPVARRNRPPVEKREYVPDPDNPVHLITNQLDAAGKRLGSLRHGEMLFHSDGCYKPCPDRFTLLYGMEFPSSGGETRFASLYRPYEQLSENMLKKLTQCQALFAYDFTLKDPIAPGSNIDDLMHARHPVLIKNPDTEKIAVYVNRLMTVQLEAMSSEDSRESLEYLFQLMEAQDNVYIHHWLPGDLLVWDNLSSAHARNTWPVDEDRLLRRCVVEGVKLAASSE